MDSELIPDLIASVTGYPIIWNYKLSIADSGKEQVNKAWAMVVKDLKGKVTLNSAKDRWRTLRDRYCKIKNENRKKHFRSGAAASTTGRVPWVYYEMMTFLDTVLDTDRTISNISNAVVADSESSEPASPSSFVSRSRNRSLGQVVSSALDRIVDVMMQPQPICQNLSEIDGFGILVVEKLKKIPDDSLRNNAMFEIMTVLHNVEQSIAHGNTLTS